MTLCTWLSMITLKSPVELNCRVLDEFILAVEKIKY